MSQPRYAQQGARAAHAARAAGLYRLDGAKRQSLGQWWQTVLLGDRKYHVGVSQGKRVRVAYSSKWGHLWHGHVRDAKGQEIWSGQVGKGDGVFAILRYAGLLPDLRVGEAIVAWGDAVRRAVDVVAPR